MATIIILVIVLFLVSVFSVQNAVPVTITFLFWKFEASLAIVIFLCTVFGMIAGAIIVALMRMKATSKKETKGSQRDVQ